MKKANYREIAEFYDKGRSLPDEITGMWMDLVKKYTLGRKDLKALDLGCGTGRFTIAMANELRYRMVGADSSDAMLMKAREKDTRKLIGWDCMDAQDLNYDDSSFDVVYISHLLHHVDSPTRVLEECFRVLNDRGIILVRYGAIEHIEKDVEHTFFPEVLDIDRARTPSIATIERWLGNTGFSEIKTEIIRQQTYATGAVHLEAVKNKHTSVMTMISSESFEQGVKRMSEYIEENPDDSWLVTDKLTITAGYKSK